MRRTSRCPATPRNTTSGRWPGVASDGTIETCLNALGRYGVRVNQPDAIGAGDYPRTSPEPTHAVRGSLGYTDLRLCLREASVLLETQRTTPPKKNALTALPRTVDLRIDARQPLTATQITGAHQSFG